MNISEMKKLPHQPLTIATFLAILSIWLVYCPSFFENARASEQRGAENILMVYGDSLSTAYGMPRESGWVALLRHKVEEKYSDWQVVNVSVSGQTTGGGLNALEAHLKKYQPDIILIELGGNDGLRGMPVRRIKNNLQGMIDLGLKYDVEPVLLGMDLPSNYGPAYTKQFSDVYEQLKDKNKITWIPQFLLPLADRPDLFLPDGIHPKAEAQPLLLERVWPMVERKIQSFR